MPANKNSFGQKQRAWVVFTDEDRIFWLRWLRPGYRHCFMIMNDDEHWLAVEPLASCMEVTVLPSPPDFNLPEWLRGQGHQVVEASLQRNVQKTAPIAPLNCVEVCKRVLGLRALYILTPYQLYRHLSGILAQAKTTKTTGENHG
ncbi:MAG TPA: hypothetical protein DIS76_03990 [Rhodospirillaceae bacterium]|nr:hypothetical protein [Rhodospirillaceae bacterium]